MTEVTYHTYLVKTSITVIHHFHKENKMPWVKHWEEETYDLVNATVTVCCEGMKVLVRSVTFSGERLWLMEMSQVPWRAILSIEYCPHCGKKVQVEAWK